MLTLLRTCLRPIGQWAAIGLHGPQDIVVAEFGNRMRARDVTWDHSVAALDPLTIAIGGAASVTGGRLTYRDARSGVALGWLDLVGAGAIGDIGLFAVRAGDHRCVGWPLRPWNRLLQARAQRRQPRKPTAFTMSPRTVEQLLIAYIAPRPVVLVSVVGPGHGNLFPMDLIGPIGEDRFALALRRTSASSLVMRDEAQIALSDPPSAARDAVYRLGGHHRQAMIDWTGLPFPIAPSERFGIPTVADALRTRELAIERTLDIGSHRFFVGRIVSDRVRAVAAQLHHTSGLHQYYRTRRGMPLPIA